MTIEKNGKTYKVAENAKSWTVSILSDCNVTATVKISKSDCLLRRRKSVYRRKRLILTEVQNGTE